MEMRPLLFLSLSCFLLSTSCAETTKTKRIGADDQVGELGTGVTSQDFRSICQRMARSLVALPQIQRATTPPKLAFVEMNNRSSEYIEGDAFLSKIRTELIRNCEGRIVFLDRSISDVLEQERRDKQRGKKTTSGDDVEYGADFFLTGDVDSIDKPAEKGFTTYFRFSFRLVNPQHEIVWEDEYEIKKHSMLGILYR